VSSAPPPVLLWLDPGGFTGFAWLFNGIFGAHEVLWDEACRQLDVACQSWGEQLHIGWERFTIRPNTHKLSPQPEAYELPGVVKFLAVKYRIKMLPPAQAHTPTRCDQDELKALGWWVPGQNDAQSAACHLLRFLRRENCLPPEYARVLAGLR
jgi:hypothetical protein